MLYHFYESACAAMEPLRAAADVTRNAFNSPLSLVSQTQAAKSLVASLDIFEHVTRRYGKPAFNLHSTTIDGKQVAVTEKVVLKRSFANLVYFDRDFPDNHKHPKVLIVAPMSSHYSTLLRGTVEAMLPEHQVYITDWFSACMVPLTNEVFDFDEYITYMIDFIQLLGPNVHVIAVCQPAVPVMAAVSILSANKVPFLPRSMTLIGGPIDPRRNATRVNQFAENYTLEHMRKFLIVKVPHSYPGAGRFVYPGFLQLAGFMTMNLDHHWIAYKEMFDSLVIGDEDSADKKRVFYEEYRSTADLTAEFYLQTVDIVFQKYLLPKGELVSHGRPVHPDKITDVPILCIEGGRDDISGIGQTKAALDITPNLPEDKKFYYLHPKVGHYGLFNGSKFRQDIFPVIRSFIEKFNVKVPEDT